MADRRRRVTAGRFDHPERRPGPVLARPAADEAAETVRAERAAQPDAHQGSDTRGAPPTPPPPLRKARSPVVWARRLLLLLGVVTLATLTILLAAYQFGRTDRGETAEGAAPEGDGQTVTSGEGFDYTQWSEGRRVFRIRSERSQQNRDETVALEEVTLDVFRSDGDIYTITSRRARFNEGTWAAELEGDVVLAGWGDLELRARALELQRNGEVLVSKGAVEFSYPPDIVGRATRLRLDRREDVVSLSGGVHIRTTPGAERPMRLDGERLVYRRGEGMVRVLDDVFVEQGDQSLRSRSLTLLLAEDQETLQTVRARWDVVASLQSVPESGIGASEIRLVGELLEIEPQPEHPDDYRFLLEGADGKLATLTATEADGMARRLVGSRLDARTSSGQLEFVEGEGAPMVLDEFLDLPEPFPLRQACARRVIARFLPDGDIGHLLLDDQVELRDTSIQVAGGQRAVLDGNTGVLDITGPAVELFDRRGRVTAPKISYSRDTGLIRASDGVRTQMSQGSGLAGTPFGEGDGPLRVESREALWTDTPPTFAFRGAVRAWQGQNLLLADQVRGDQGGQEMAASGGVRTVWRPAAGDRTAAGSAAGDDAPVSVEAERMTFRQNSHELVYHEDVRIEQEDRTIRCQELTVSLTPDTNEAERMQCRGDVLLNDPTQGRRVTGDLAIFEVAIDQVEIFGEQVKVVDASRSSMTGRYLAYDLEAGTVELKSRPPVASGEGG